MQQIIAIIVSFVFKPIKNDQQAFVQQSEQGEIAHSHTHTHYTAISSKQYTREMPGLFIL